MAPLPVAESFDAFNARGGEFLVEPVGGDRQVVMAVRGAHPKPPWRSCSDGGLSGLAK